MGEAQNPRQSPQDGQQARRTFEQIQQMHHAMNAADKPDRTLAAAEEYVADNTYRQSEEAGSARKIDQGISMAALISADYQTVKDTEAFDRLDAFEQTAVITEYQKSARDIVRREVSDFDVSGHTAEELYQQGYVDYSRKLSDTEREKLEAWCTSPNPAADPSLAGTLEQMNLAGFNFDLSNMAVARTQVKGLLDDGTVSFRKELSQEAMDALKGLTEDTSRLSAVTKSKMMDTVRTRKLGQLKQDNDSVRKFMEQHPYATKMEWRRAMDASGKHAVLDEEAVSGLDKLFSTYGDITQSTGLYRRDATTRALTFFTGDLAPAINLMSMGGRMGYKAYDIAYRKWLEKSKDTSTEAYRKSLRESRDGLRSTNARTRYEARNRTRDIRREHRFEKKQAKKYGSDRKNWDSDSAPVKKRKSFDDTLKGKSLNKLNNSAAGKFLGKMFGLKGVLKKLALLLGKYLLIGFGVLSLSAFMAALALAPLLVVTFLAAGTFQYMFSSLSPEYAQNCINSLNILDEMYVRAVENETYLAYMKPGELGEVTGESIYESPKYDTQIKLDGTNIGQFVDEYGNEIASGNNILPIFSAFKYRTGCDVNESTYVAAAAYGQMMYWRTHSVSPVIGDGNSDGHLDFVEDCGCGEYKHTKPMFSPSGLVPSDKKGYCDDYNISVSEKTSCGKSEHVHGGIESSCYRRTCNGHHDESCYEWHVFTYPDGTVGSMRIRVCGTDCHYGSPFHTDSCYKFVCKKEEHTHSNQLSYNDHTYSTPCYKVTVTCNKHCPGHVTAQRTITCIMDITNIVKRDDLIFAEDAMTYGEDVFQWTGTVESNFTAWADRVGDWWAKLFGTTELFDTADFYNDYIMNTRYGVGGNEAVMFKAAGDTEHKAIFYENASILDAMLGSQQVQAILHTYSVDGSAIKEELKLNFLRGGRYRNYTRTEEPWYQALLDVYHVRSTYCKDGIPYASDYLSPFIFDTFTLDGEIPLFRNGWGFYDVSATDKWIWCVDPDFLLSCIGIYEDGYQYAVDAFHGESGIAFSNSAPSIDGSSIEDTDLRSAFAAVERLGSDAYIDGSMAYAVTRLMNELGNRTVTPELLISLGDSAWYDRMPETGFFVGANTLLARKYLYLTDHYEGSWEHAQERYYYLYVVSPAEDTGNWGASETYYYCLLYEAEAAGCFRFVLLSETELNLYERSLCIK